MYEPLKQQKKILHIILPIFFLTIGSILSQAAICEEELITGNNCTIATPVLDCTLYNYTIYDVTTTGGTIIQEGNLTTLNDSIYYFNLNLTSVGDYVIKLCDETTRQIKIINAPLEDNKMIATILGLAALAGFLIFFGTKHTNPVIKWISYVLAGVEAVLISASIYTLNAGLDMTFLLQVNMYSFGVSLMTLLLISLAFKNVAMASGEELDDRKVDDSKNGWSKEW